MNRKSCFLDNSGITMVVVMMGLVAAMGSFAGLMQLLDKSRYVQTDLRQSLEIVNLVNRVDGILARPSYCAASMNGLTVTNGTAVTTLKYNPVTASPIAVGNYFTGVELKRMIIANPINILDPSSKEFDLALTLVKDSLEVVRKIKVIAKVNGSNQITSCVATRSEAGAAENFCRLTDGETDLNRDCMYTDTGNDVSTDLINLMGSLVTLDGIYTNDERIRLCRLDSERIGAANSSPHCL